MIDKALGLQPVQTESYYFQLYPINLHLKKLPVPNAGNTFKFAIYKGQQQFDCNKLPMPSKFQKFGKLESMALPKCQLNFYLPSYNKNRKVMFELKLNMTQNNEEYEMATYEIDAEPYILKFKEKGTTRFEETSPLSEEFDLEYEIYIEKSRFNLEKLVKEFKNERGMKSPERKDRNSEVGSSTNSAVKKNLTPKHSHIKTTEDSEMDKKSEPRQTQSQMSQPERKSEVKQSPARQSPARQSQQSQQQSKKMPEIVKETRETHIHKDDVISQSSKNQDSVVSPMLKSRPVKMKQEGEKVLRRSQRLSVNKQLESQLDEIKKSHEASQNPQTMYYLKITLFILVSLFLMYNAMSPTRKYTPKGKRK